MKYDTFLWFGLLFLLFFGFAVQKSRIRYFLATWRSQNQFFNKEIINKRNLCKANL